MATWTRDDLLKLDAKYANSGVHPHQRPLHAATELLGSAFVLGIGGNPEVTRILDAYSELVPEVDTTWPGAGIGLVASIDQVRKVVLPVVFGSYAMQPWQSLGFTSAEEWWNWCRKDHDIAALSSFAIADLYDFVYGLDEVAQDSPEAMTLYHMARSNLEDIANVLPTAFCIDSVIQPICLVAELVLKGALVWGGVDPDSFKRGRAGHNLKLLAEKVVLAHPHRDDSLVAEVISALPPYVDSRYRPAGLTRLEVVRLAIGVQFVAGSSLRRITSIDLAAQMAAGGWPAPRRPFFPK